MSLIISFHFASSDVSPGSHVAFYGQQHPSGPWGLGSRFPVARAGRVASTAEHHGFEEDSSGAVATSGNMDEGEGSARTRRGAEEGQHGVVGSRERGAGASEHDDDQGGHVHDDEDDDHDHALPGQRFPLFSPPRASAAAVLGREEGDGGGGAVGGGRRVPPPSADVTPSSVQLGLLNSVSPSMLLGPGAGASWLGGTSEIASGGVVGGAGEGTGMSVAAPSFVQTSQLAPLLLSQMNPHGSFGEGKILVVFWSSLVKK